VKVCVLYTIVGIDISILNDLGWLFKNKTVAIYVCMVRRMFDIYVYVCGYVYCTTVCRS